MKRAKKRKPLIKKKKKQIWRTHSKSIGSNDDDDSTVFNVIMKYGTSKSDNKKNKKSLERKIVNHKEKLSVFHVIKTSRQLQDEVLNNVK